MKILITGDLVINREYSKSNISDSVISLFNQSDLNIVNLEAPVTNSTSKIIKTGPHLKSERESTLDVLNALDIDIVTLANNHVKDYDEQGVADTLTFCKENNIKSVGAGMNLKEASETLYIDSEEGKIAIINFAENEWASATDESAGAHPMDIIDNAKEIQRAKEKADFVFVIVHGGHEYYNLPSPRMQKQYRFYAEQGADIVIGHHTHCINGNEIYKGTPIYYSLGNFIFTKKSSYKDWFIGVILEIKINNSKLTHVLHPVKQDFETYSLSFQNNKELNGTLKRISTYNTIITNEHELKRNYREYVESSYNKYLNYWSPFSFLSNSYIKRLLFKLNVKGLNKDSVSLIFNLMRCESHSDMSQEVIKRYINRYR